jgi:ribonucleoside-triphosphate reductase
MLEHPESMRMCGFQNVTINLPQAAYRAKGDLEKTISEIEKTMDIAMKAHLQKKKFISWLMEPGLPLWQVGKKAFDDRPYIDLETATYIIGILGLTECVKRITGFHLHESEDSFKTGIKIISSMYLKAKKLEKEHKLSVKLEESPAESATYRLAKVDLNNFAEAKDYVQGDLASGIVYYVNSCHFPPDAQASIFERIEKQAKFHSLIESGAITHVFLGEQKPSDTAIESLVRKTWENTQTAQLTISPEFTICFDCKKVSRGYNRDKVPSAKENS